MKTLTSISEHSDYLEEPHREDYDMYDDTVFMIHYKDYKDYQEALYKVLFEGCDLMDGWCIKLPCSYLLGSEESLNSQTIEDLVPYNLPLTKTALKQIGLWSN